MDESIEKSVVNFSLQKPAYGQLKICNKLEEIRSFYFDGRWAFCLVKDTIFKTFQKRLKALEA
ncbi:hypothetical protein DB41_FN00090 [Neochlamydia sp. TUME1]|nr:hypothetical protein DB41_FN00090 [Neochlamydia sp. TUME1]